MTGYILQFIAMASFGISNCLWSFPLKKMPVLLLIAARAAITSLFFLLLIILQSNFEYKIFQQFYLPISAYNINDIFLSVSICAVSYFGLFFFNLAIKHGSVSLSIPILCIGTLVSVLIGVIFYMESFTLFKAVAGFIFILGLWCLEKLNKQMWKFSFSKGASYSLLAMFFWSASSFYLVGIGKIGALTFSLVLELTVCLMSVLGFVLQKKETKSFVFPRIKENLNWILLLSIFGFCGVFFTNLAFLFLPVSTLGLFAIIQPVISIFFAGLFLKEKLQPIQYAGAAIILFGIWLSAL